MVAIVSGMEPCFSIGSTMARLNTNPSSTIPTPPPTTMAGSSGRWPKPMAPRIRNAGSTTNSPCAKFTVPAVCHSSVKPIATRA